MPDRFAADASRQVRSKGVPPVCPDRSQMAGTGDEVAGPNEALASAADAAPVRDDREEHFRTLVENIPGVATYLDRVIVEDPGHSIPLYISPQVQDMLGYPLSAWLDEDELWLQILHPEDRDRLIKADEEARRDLKAMSEEYRLIHRDGHVVWVSEKSAVVPDVSTGALYWQGVMVDITKRKLAEQALSASELKFRTLFDAASIGVFTLELDGTIREANVTIEWLGRYESGELAGAPLGDLLDPADEDVMLELAELRAGHRDRSQLEHRFLRKDGSSFWCRIVIALVRDANLKPVYAMGMLEDISDRKLLEDELLRRAVHDPLTGLPNRQLLLDRLTVGVARSEREMNVGVTVVFVDIDDFKEVNDTYGHQTGDDLLVEVAKRLMHGVRPADTVARYGGDEFVVVVVGQIGAPQDAREFAERLAADLKRPFHLGANVLAVTTSLGVTVCSDPEVRPEDLIREADAAMYRAKWAGRDRVELSERWVGTVDPATAPPR
jgi:diguanylate cyclase (GGDEF)-like protein/PAS domain S-box-containing protein